MSALAIVKTLNAVEHACTCGHTDEISQLSTMIKLNEHAIEQGIAMKHTIVTMFDKRVSRLSAGR